jgi:hypothetical protein
VNLNRDNFLLRLIQFFPVTLSACLVRFYHEGNLPRDSLREATSKINQWETKKEISLPLLLIADFSS